MVVVRPVFGGWIEFNTIKELTDRYEEALDIFEKHYGSKNGDTAYYNYYGRTTPEEMSDESKAYQASVAYVIVGGMNDLFEFEEVYTSYHVLGFRIRRVLLSGDFGCYYCLDDIKRGVCE